MPAISGAVRKMHDLYEAGDIKGVWALIRNGVDLNARDSSGEALLHKAILNEALVAALIKAGANVNVRVRCRCICLGVYVPLCYCASTFLGSFYTNLLGKALRRNLRCVLIGSACKMRKRLMMNEIDYGAQRTSGQIRISLCTP